MKDEIKRLVGGIRDLLIKGLTRTAQPLSDDREAIWSIPKPFKRAYYAWVGLLWTPTLVVIIVENIPAAGSVEWWMLPIAVIRLSGPEFAPIGISVAIAGLLVVQGGMVIVSIYQAIVNRFVTPVIEDHRAEGREEGREEGRKEGRTEGRAEGREEGREEGRTETNRAWREWLRRRAEAEERGLPFNEPQPDEDI